MARLQPFRLELSALSPYLPYLDRDYCTAAREAVVIGDAPLTGAPFAVADAKSGFSSDGRRGFDSE